MMLVSFWLFVIVRYESETKNENCVKKIKKKKKKLIEL